MERSCSLREPGRTVPTSARAHAGSEERRRKSPQRARNIAVHRVGVHPVLPGRFGFNGWTLRFSAFVAGDGEAQRFVPSKWSLESRSSLNEIVRESQQDSLRRRGIRLEAYCYDFTPAVHGFGIGNGDVYFSVLRWEEDQISRQGYSYEYLRHANDTASAEMLRTVFASWMARSCATEWPAPVESPEQTGGH